MLPTSLEILDISDGGATYRDFRKFTGGIPIEWGALTNLKELKMACCGLDGAFGSTRSERFTSRLEMIVFVQALCQKCSRLHSRCSTSAAMMTTRTSSLAESRLNGAHSRISRSPRCFIVDLTVSCSASGLSASSFFCADLHYWVHRRNSCRSFALEVC